MEQEEAVDEFGRPLRPNRDSSSDSSDSDREYDSRYRKRRSSRERDYERYSPDRYSRRGDHSPERRRRSPSPQYRGRGRGGRDDWEGNNINNGYRGSGSSGRNGFPSMMETDNVNNGNGLTSSGSPITTSTSGGGGSGSHSNNNGHSSTTAGGVGLAKSLIGGPKRIQKRGDIFEGGYFRSYKQFLDYQDDSITPSEADKKYEEYKIEYSKRQSRVFFKEHQQEEWFKEKYDPFFLSKKRKEKVEKSKSFIQTFSLNLNDENHKFSLESKDNIKEGDKLDLDGLDMHHQINNDQQENTVAATTTTTTNEEGSGSDEKSTTTSEDKMEEDEKNKIKDKIKQDDKEKSTLFIKAVSPTCTKDELLEVLNKVGGGETCVTKLTLSEPVRYKNFYRLGWVTFKNSEFASKALKELNGYKMRDFDLYLNFNKPSEDAERRFKITPNIASTENRINIDLEQSTTLMKLFDENKGITNNPINSFEKWNSLSTIERLDRTILYLRYVHFYCYYCSEEFNDECETTRKCGTIHLRRTPGEQTSIITNTNTTITTTTTTTTTTKSTEDKINEEKIVKEGQDEEDNDNNNNNAEKEKDDNNNNNNNNKEDEENKKEEEKDGCDEKSTEETTAATTTTTSQSMEIEKPKLTSESEMLWVTSLDNNTKSKINKIPTSEEQYTCKESIEKAAEEYINTNTEKIEEEKFKCRLCSKLFKGAEYVKKHINLKHPEELKKESETKGTEEQFFLNYFSDPRRITPLPPQNQNQMGGVFTYGGPPGASMVVGAGGRGGHGAPPTTQMLPRTRFNPAIGQWETVVVPMILPPGMIPNQPGMVQIMSPVFASPNGIRGRGNGAPNGVPVGGNGVPTHMVGAGGGPIPMRRSYGGAGSAGINGGGNLSPNAHRYGGPPPGMDGTPPQSMRYRPYPSQPTRHSTSSMDPRGIREYVDLDAPIDHVPEIDYRSALKEYQNKKSL